MKASPRKVVPGSYATVSAAGFHRDTTVTVGLGGAVLGSFTSDVNGSGRITVQIPGGTAAARGGRRRGRSNGGKEVGGYVESISRRVGLAMRVTCIDEEIGGTGG